MKTKNLLEVPTSWPRTHRSWNQQFISNKLAELARQGIYFDSYVRSNEEVDSRTAPFARGVLPTPLEDGVGVNSTWEEQDDSGEEDIEPVSVQSIIRKSLYL